MLPEPSPMMNLVTALLLGLAIFAALWLCRVALQAIWEGMTDDRREKITAVLMFVFGPKTEPIDALALIVFGNVALGAGLMAAGLNLGSVIFVVVVGMCMPIFLYYRADNQRSRELELALPLALQQVANEMAAGATLETALKLVADSAPPPADIEIARLQRRVEVMGIDAAFTEMAERLDSRSFALTASVVRVGTSSGGRLIEALKSLSRTLIEIERLNKKIRTASENGRRNIYLMSIIGPLIALGSGFVVDHETSLMDDGLGQVLILISVLMFLAAHVLGYFMTKVKV